MGENSSNIDLKLTGLWKKTPGIDLKVGEEDKKRTRKYNLIRLCMQICLNMLTLVCMPAFVKSTYHKIRSPRGGLGRGVRTSEFPTSAT